MKTTMFGCICFAITVFTIVIVLNICNDNTRTNNLQDNLQSAMEASLETAMSENSYSINNTEELIADFMQGVALYLDENCSLDVAVKAADTSAGILSVSVTEHYQNQNGTITDITCEKTIILEEYDMDMLGKYMVSYLIKDVSGNETLYKSYTLTEGSQVIVPVSPSVPGAVFKGWKLEETNTIMSTAQIQSLSLDKDYKFYAVFE